MEQSNACPVTWALDACSYENKHSGMHSFEVQGLDVISDSEKLEFLYQVALKADKLMQEVGPQLLPMLDGIAKNPMLKMFLK